MAGDRCCKQADRENTYDVRCEPSDPASSKATPKPCTSASVSGNRWEIVADGPRYVSKQFTT